MKFLFALFTFAFLSMNVFAQEQQLSPRVKTSRDNIEIAYGQPSVRGRAIFGDIVPYDEMWRAGANEATEITFRKDATFGGKPVKAGTYTLFVLPKQKEWTVILNSTLGQWGAYEYGKIKDKDILQVTVPVRTLTQPVEKLTYTIGREDISLEWDKTGITIPVTF